MKQANPLSALSQSFQTSPLIHVHSNWLAMALGFFGWVILLTCSIGLYFLVNRYLRFYDDFNAGGIWMYILIAIPALMFCAGFYFIYDKYFPRQWITDVAVDFDEKNITIKSRNGTRVLPFDRIDKGIYQGASPIFTTHYMYWVEVEGERIPLVVFTSERVSHHFYDMLERRAGLIMVQEPGN